MADRSGLELLAEIESTECRTPALWWLGQRGFAIKHREMIFYLDPPLASGGPQLDPAWIAHADLVLVGRPEALASARAPELLAASSQARLIVPKGSVRAAEQMGVPVQRVAAIDADLRIEYFKGGNYANLYGVPAARLNALRKPELDWSGMEGYPRLGFVVRMEGLTVYHAGLSPYYPGLAERLRRYQATVMLCAIGPGGFTPAEAAELAEDCGIAWVAPMPGSPVEPAWVDGFVDHMLGHRPAQRFKVFQFGEGWRPND